MRRKTLTRWAVGGAIILLLGAVILGLLVRERGDDGTLERVQATGELRVGLDASFPPFESLDADGNVVGFDVDLARAIAGALGAEPVFVNVGFDGLYDALWAGRVDVVISGLPYDPRRTQDVIYSEPYFNAGQVLVVRADDEAFSDLGAGSSDPGADALWSALSGRVVAVEWGSLADMEARRLKETAPGMATLPQPTARDALNAVISGQADAAIADTISVYQRHFCRRHFCRFMGEGTDGLTILTTLTDEPYVIASRLKSRRLAEAIDRALADLRESGALDQLGEKWF